MGLLLLLLVGAVFGWLASIMTQPAENGDDPILIASGAVSAVVAGLAVYDGSAITGLSPQAFIGAALASAIVIACVVSIRRSSDAPSEDRSRLR